MGINGSHLVEETLCDADDHVFDQRLDSSKAGVVLALAVPHHKLDLAAFGRLDHSAGQPLSIPSVSWLAAAIPYVHVNMLNS
jgi:hypothetical protein